MTRHLAPFPWGCKVRTHSWLKKVVEINPDFGGCDPGHTGTLRGREYNEDNSFRSAGGLITNENLHWSIDFLIRYEEHIDFDELWGHLVWDKAFKPYIDKKMVNTLFRLI